MSRTKAVGVLTVLIAVLTALLNVLSDGSYEPGEPAPIVLESEEDAGEDADEIPDAVDAPD